MPFAPDRTFEDQSDVLSTYRTDYPQYTSWGDQTLYSTLVKSDPTIETRVKKDAAPAFRDFSQVLGSIREVNKIGPEVTDDALSAQVLSSMPELNVFRTKAPKAQEGPQLSPEEQSFRTRFPKWVGPMLTSDIESLPAWGDYSGIMARNAQGQAGFGEQFGRNWESMIPFYGSVVGVTDVAKVALTARALSNGQRVSDEDLLDMNVYIAEQDRAGSADWVGKAGSVIAGSIGFAGEFAVTAGIGSIFAKAGTKTALKLGTSSLQNVLKSLAARSVGATVWDDAAVSAGKKVLGAVAKIAGRSDDMLAFAQTTGGKFLRRGTETAVRASLGGATQVAAVTGLQLAATSGATGEATTARAAESEISARLTDQDYDQAAAIWSGMLGEWVERSSEFVGGDVMSATGAALRGTILRPFADQLVRARAGITDLVKGRLSAGALNHFVQESAKKSGVAYTLAKFAIKHNLDLDTALKGLKAVGYDGIVEEMAEERVGGFLHGLFGTDGNEASLSAAFDGMIPNSEEAKTELLAFTVPIASAMAASNIQKSLLGVPGRLEKIQSLFQGKWAPVYSKDADGKSTQGTANEKIVDFTRTKTTTAEHVDAAIDTARVIAETEIDNKSIGSKVLDYAISLATLPITWDFGKLQYGTLERAIQEAEIFDFINTPRQLRNYLVATEGKSMDEANDYVFGKAVLDADKKPVKRADGSIVREGGIMPTLVRQAIQMVAVPEDAALAKELADFEANGAFGVSNGRLYVNVGADTTPGSVSQNMSQLMNRLHIGRVYDVKTVAKDGVAPTAGQIAAPVEVDDTETLDLIKRVNDPSNADAMADALQLYIRIGPGRTQPAPWLVKNSGGILKAMKQRSAALNTMVTDSISAPVTNGVEFIDKKDGSIHRVIDVTDTHVEIQRRPDVGRELEDNPYLSKAVPLGQLGTQDSDFTRVTKVLRPTIQPTYRGTRAQLKAYMGKTLEGQVRDEDVFQDTGEGSGKDRIYHLRMGATTYRDAGPGVPPILAVHWNASSSPWHLLEDLFELRSRSVYESVSRDPFVKKFLDELKSYIAKERGSAAAAAEKEGKPGKEAAKEFMKEFAEIAQAINDRPDELYFKIVGQIAAMYDEKYFGQVDTLPWAKQISRLREMPGIAKLVIDKGVPHVAKFLGAGWETKYRNPYATAEQIVEHNTYVAAVGLKTAPATKVNKPTPKAAASEQEPNAGLEAVVARVESRVKESVAPAGETEKAKAARIKPIVETIDGLLKAIKDPEMVARLEAAKATLTGTAAPPKAEATPEPEATPEAGEAPPAAEPPAAVGDAQKEKENLDDWDIIEGQGTPPSTDPDKSASVEGVTDNGLKAGYRVAGFWRGNDPDDKFLELRKAFALAIKSNAPFDVRVAAAEALARSMAVDNPFDLTEEELVARTPGLYLTSPSDVALLKRRAGKRLSAQDLLAISAEEAEGEDFQAGDEGELDKEDLGNTGSPEDARDKEDGATTRTAESDNDYVEFGVASGINATAAELKDNGAKADAQYGSWQSKIMLWAFDKISGKGVSLKNIPILVWEDPEVAAITKYGTPEYILNDSQFPAFLAAPTAITSAWPVGLQTLHIVLKAIQDKRIARQMARQTLECLELSPTFVGDISLSPSKEVTKGKLVESKSAAPFSMRQRIDASLRTIFNGDSKPITKAARELTKALEKVAISFGDPMVVRGAYGTANVGFLDSKYRKTGDDYEARKDILKFDAKDAALISGKIRDFLGQLVSPMPGIQPVSEELRSLVNYTLKGQIAVSSLRALQGTAELVASLGELREAMESSEDQTVRDAWAKERPALLRDVLRLNTSHAQRFAEARGAPTPAANTVLDGLKTFHSQTKKATLSQINILTLVMSEGIIADGRKPGTKSRVGARIFDFPLAKHLRKLGVKFGRILGVNRKSGEKGVPMPFDSDRFRGEDVRRMSRGLWNSFVSDTTGKVQAVFIPYLGDKTTTPWAIFVPVDVVSELKAKAKAITVATHPKPEERVAARTEVYREAITAMSKWLYEPFHQMSDKDFIKFLIKRTSKLTTGGMHLSSTYEGGLGEKTYVLVLQAPKGKNNKMFDGSAFAARGADARFAVSMGETEMPTLLKIGHQSGSDVKQVHIKPLVNRSDVVDRPGSSYNAILNAVDAAVAAAADAKNPFRVDIITDNGAAKIYPKDSSREIQLTINGTLVFATLVETETSEWVDTTSVTHSTSASPQPMMKPVFYDIMSRMTANFGAAMSAYSTSALSFLKTRGTWMSQLSREDAYDAMVAGFTDEQVAAFDLPQLKTTLSIRMAALLSKISKPKIDGVPSKLLMSGGVPTGKIDANGKPEIEWSMGIPDRWLRDFVYAEGQLQATWIRANIEGARYGYHVKTDEAYDRKELESDLMAAVSTDPNVSAPARSRLAAHLVDYAGNPFDVSHALDDLFNSALTALRSDAIIEGEDVPDSKYKFFIPGEWVLLERVPGGRKAANPPGRLTAPITWDAKGKPGKANAIVLHPGPQTRNGADGDADSFMVYLFSKATGGYRHRSIQANAEWLSSPLVEKDFVAANTSLAVMEDRAPGEVDAEAWATTDAAGRLEMASRIQRLEQNRYLYALSNDILRSALESFDRVDKDEMMSAVDKAFADDLDGLDDYRKIDDIQREGVVTTIEDFHADPHKALEAMSDSVSGRGYVISLYAASQSIWRRLGAFDSPNKKTGKIAVFPVSYRTPDGIRTLEFSNPRQDNEEVLWRTMEFLGNVADIVIDNGNEPRIQALGLNDATFPLFAAMALYRGLGSPEAVHEFVKEWLDALRDSSGALATYSKAKLKYQTGVFAEAFNADAAKNRIKKLLPLIDKVETKGQADRDKLNVLALQLRGIAEMKSLSGRRAVPAEMAIAQAELAVTDLDAWRAFRESANSLSLLDERMSLYQAAANTMTGPFSRPRSAADATYRSERVLEGGVPGLPNVPGQEFVAKSDPLMSGASAYYRYLMTSAYAPGGAHVLHSRNARLAILLSRGMMETGVKASDADWFRKAKDAVIKPTVAVPDPTISDIETEGKIRSQDSAASDRLVTFAQLESMAKLFTPESLAKHQILTVAKGYGPTNAESNGVVRRDKLLSQPIASATSFDSVPGAVDLGAQVSGLLESVPQIVDALVTAMPELRTIFQTRTIGNRTIPEAASVFSSADLTKEDWERVRGLWPTLKSALAKQGGTLKVPFEWKEMLGNAVTDLHDNQKVPHIAFSYDEILQALAYYSVLKFGSKPSGASFFAALPLEFQSALGALWTEDVDAGDDKVDERRTRDWTRRLADGKYDKAAEYYPQAMQRRSPAASEDWKGHHGLQQIRGFIEGAKSGDIFKALSKKLGKDQLYLASKPNTAFEVVKDTPAPKKKSKKGKGAQVTKPAKARNEKTVKGLEDLGAAGIDVSASVESSDKTRETATRFVSESLGLGNVPDNRYVLRGESVAKLLSDAAKLASDMEAPVLGSFLTAAATVPVGIQPRVTLLPTTRGYFLDDNSTVYSASPATDAEVEARSDIKFQAAGLAHPTNGVTVFSPAFLSPLQYATVLGHEWLHSQSVRALDEDPIFRGNVTSLYNTTVTWMAANRPEVDLKAVYGMTNVKEFLAESFTNRKFQTLLAEIPVDPIVPPAEKSVWTKFLSALRLAVQRVLGAKAPSVSVLDQVLDATVDLIEYNTGKHLEFLDYSGRVDKAAEVTPMKLAASTEELSALKSIASASIESSLEKSQDLVRRFKSRQAVAIPPMPEDLWEDLLEKLVYANRGDGRWTRAGSFDGSGMVELTPEQAQKEWAVFKEREHDLITDTDFKAPTDFAAVAETVEEWKRENNIVYNPEEAHKRGEAFYHDIGAFNSEAPGLLGRLSRVLLNQQSKLRKGDDTWWKDTENQLLVSAYTAAVPYTPGSKKLFKEVSDFTVSVGNDPSVRYAKFDGKWYKQLTESTDSDNAFQPMREEDAKWAYDTFPPGIPGVRPGRGLRFVIKPSSKNILWAAVGDVYSGVIKKEAQSERVEFSSVMTDLDSLRQQLRDRYPGKEIAQTALMVLTLTPVGTSRSAAWMNPDGGATRLNFKRDGANLYSFHEVVKPGKKIVVDPKAPKADKLSMLADSVDASIEGRHSDKYNELGVRLQLGNFYIEAPDKAVKAVTFEHEGTWFVEYPDGSPSDPFPGRASAENAAIEYNVMNGIVEALPPELQRLNAYLKRAFIIVNGSLDPIGKAPETTASAESAGAELRQMALQRQRDAGWDTRWPFIPADVSNPRFQDAIRMDPSLSETEKTRILSFAPGGEGFQRLNETTASAESAGSATQFVSQYAFAKTDKYPRNQQAPRFRQVERINAHWAPLVTAFDALYDNTTMTPAAREAALHKLLEEHHLSKYQPSGPVVLGLHKMARLQGQEVPAAPVQTELPLVTTSVESAPEETPAPKAAGQQPEPPIPVQIDLPIGELPSTAVEPEYIRKFRDLIEPMDAEGNRARRLKVENRIDADGTRRHVYLFNGVEITAKSVTTKIGEHPHFRFKGERKAEYDELADNGTKFHAMVENVVNNAEDALPEVRAAVEKIIEKGDIVFSEVSLRIRDVVGTADMIVFRPDGTVRIIDVKTTKTPLGRIAAAEARSYGVEGTPSYTAPKVLKNLVQLLALERLLKPLVPEGTYIDSAIWHVHIDPASKKFHAADELAYLEAEEDDMKSSFDYFEEMFGENVVPTPTPEEAPKARAVPTGTPGAANEDALLIVNEDNADVAMALAKEWLKKYPSAKAAGMAQSAFNLLGPTIRAIAFPKAEGQLPKAKTPSKTPGKATSPKTSSKTPSKPAAPSNADLYAASVAAKDAVLAEKDPMKQKAMATQWYVKYGGRAKSGNPDQQEWMKLFASMRSVLSERATAPTTPEEDSLMGDIADLNDTIANHASFHSAVWNLRTGPSGSTEYLTSRYGSKAVHTLFMKRWKEAIAWLNKETVENRRINNLLGLDGQIRDLNSPKVLGNLTEDEMELVEQFTWAVTAIYDYRDIRPNGYQESRAYVIFKALSDGKITKEAALKEFATIAPLAQVAWGRAVAGTDRRMELASDVLSRWYGSSAYLKLKAAGRTDADLTPFAHLQQYHDFVESAPDEIRRVRGYVTQRWGGGYQDKISRDVERELRRTLHSMAVPAVADTLLTAEMVDPKTQNEPASREHVEFVVQFLGLAAVDVDSLVAGKQTKSQLNGILRKQLTERWTGAETDRLAPPNVADGVRTVGPKVIKTLKLLASMQHRSGAREWTPRSLERTKRGNYATQMADSIRARNEFLANLLATNTPTPEEAKMPPIKMPQTLNFIRLRQMYVQDTMVALRNQQIANDMINTPGVDGVPEVVMVPKNATEINRDLLTPGSLENATKMLAGMLGQPYKNGVDFSVQLSDLAAKLPTGEYVEVASPFDSVSKIFVRKGDTEAVVRHWIETPLKYEVNGVDLLNDLMHVTQWSKSLAVAFSGFFPISVLETVLASPWYLVNLIKHPKAMWGRLRDIFKKKASSDPDLEGLIYDMTIGGIMLGDEYAVDEQIGLLDRDLEVLVNAADLRWGPKAAKAVKLALRWGTGRRLAEEFFGAPGKHGGVFQSLKIHASEVVANQIAKEWGATSLDALAPAARQKVFEQIAPFMNGSAGGQFWQGYLWATPRIRQLLNLVMFAPNWTLSAFNVAGGGMLTGRLLGNTQSAMTSRLVMRNAAVMLPVVLFTIPTMIQAGVWAAAAAGGGTGPDDDPWMWNNEPGRKTHIDITPLARLSPLYAGDPTGKRRVYVRFGKQAFEVYDGWATEPVDQLMRKLSNPAKIVFEQVTGRSPGSDWTLEFSGKGMAGLVATTDYQGNITFLKSRLGYIAQKFLPMSAMSSFANMDAGLTGFFVPVSRGVSQGKAATELSVVLNTIANPEVWRGMQEIEGAPANINELGAKILRAAERNGFDTKIIINSAKGAVLSRLYKEYLAALDDSDIPRMDSLAKSILRVGGTLKGLTQSVTKRQAGSGKEPSAEELAAMAESFK